MDHETTRVRLETGGGDPDEAQHRLSLLYNGDEWSASPTRCAFSYRYAAIGDGAMTLRSSKMTGRLVGGTGHPDDIVVQWIVSGRARVDIARDAIEMELGRPVLFPVGRSFAFDFVDYDQRLVHLSRPAVERTAAEKGLLGPLRFDHHHRASAATVQKWREAVSATSRSLRAERMDPLHWDELTRSTIGALLELYPPDATPLPPEVLLPRNARLRAAIEFVHARAAEPIGPTEVAAAAGLSVRGLQSAFQRALGMRPIAYIRLARLDHAHADLALGSPHTTTVAEVARRWGFGNAGRFSAAYVSRFGELPSATLQS